MDEATDQQVVPLVGRPKQLQAGDRRPLANRIAHRQQPLRRREVVRLVGEGQAMAIKPVLHLGQGQANPVDPQGREQFCQGHPVFHRHRPTAMEHHRQARRGQHQGHQGQQGCGAAAAVVGHAETEGPPPRGRQGWAVLAIALEHAGELDRQGPADAVGNQEGPQLGVTGLARQHQVHRLPRFRARQPRARVFAATNLAQQLAEAQGLTTETPTPSWGQGPGQGVRDRCSGHTHYL